MTIRLQNQGSGAWLTALRAQRAPQSSLLHAASTRAPPPLPKVVLPAHEPPVDSPTLLRKHLWRKPGYPVVQRLYEVLRDRRNEQPERLQRLLIEHTPRSGMDPALAGRILELSGQSASIESALQTFRKERAERIPLLGSTPLDLSLEQILLDNPMVEERLLQGLQKLRLAVARNGAPPWLPAVLETLGRTDFAPDYFEWIAEKLGALLGLHPPGSDRLRFIACTLLKLELGRAPKGHRSVIKRLRAQPPKRALELALMLRPCADHLRPELFSALLNALQRAPDRVRTTRAQRRFSQRYFAFGRGLLSAEVPPKRAAQLALILADRNPVCEDKRSIGQRIGRYLAILGCGAPLFDDAARTVGFGLFDIAKRAHRFRVSIEDSMAEVIDFLRSLPEFSDAPRSLRFALALSCGLARAPLGFERTSSRIREDLRAASLTATLEFWRANPHLPAELCASLLRLPSALAGSLSRTLNTAQRSQQEDWSLTVWAALSAHQLSALERLHAHVKASKAAGCIASFSRTETEVSWPLIHAALDRGEDPTAQLWAAQSEKLSRALGLAGSTDDNEELSRCAPALLQIYRGLQSPVDGDLPLHRLRRGLRTLTQNIDRWPSLKYEGDIAARALGALSPEQLAAWRSPAREEVAATDRAQDSLLKGTLAALEGPALCREASLRALSVALRAPPPLDPGVLRAAQRTLKRLELPELRRAVRQLEQLMRSGPERYCIDEDRLSAFFLAHHSGCMTPQRGFRSWALLCAAMDPNVRMLRVHRDHQQLCRAYLKVLSACFMGPKSTYRGPVLWLDDPVPDSGGSAQDERLLYRGALAKAQAMELPLLSETSVDNMLKREGEKMGRPTAQGQKVLLQIDSGRFGLHYSDALLQGYARSDEARIERACWVRSIVLPKRSAR